MNPESGLLLVHKLENGKFTAPASSLGAVEVPVAVLPGVVVDLT